MKTPQQVAVIGGGILGLETARLLQAEGHQITILEAAPHVGGLASPWQLDDVTWDQFYHVILLSDSCTRDLVNKLGLEEDFRAVETKTGFYTDGQLYSMSNTLEFLKFPPLGMVSKLRLGGTIFHASRIKDWRALERIPVVDWLNRWSGTRTTQKIWLPLLRAKLGESYQESSAAFLWATIARMYAARRSGLKKELFGYVRGGYAKLLARFETYLRERDVSIRTGVRVQSITSNDNGVTIETDTETLNFDRVIVTTPTNIAARLLPELTDAEQARLNNIRYQGIVCASVLLKQKLADFYVTNITDPAPFTAVIEMSALVDREEFQGKHLVYLPKYISAGDPIYTESDESIQSRFLARLQEMYPHFTPSDVLAFKVARVKNVFPIPILNYSETVPPVRTSLPNVYLVNSAQIVNGTLNVNETLKRAREAVAEYSQEPARALQEATV